MTLFDDQLHFDNPFGYDGDSFARNAGATGDEFADFLPPSRILPSARAIANTLMLVPDAEALVTIEEIEQLLLATQARILARADDGSGRQAENLASRGKKSTRKKRKKAAKRAKAVKNNPDLANDVENGDISEEQLDDLADADEKTDGAASQDPDLMEKVKDSNPDQSRDDIKNFVDQHNTPEGESKHEKQRRIRKLSRFETKRGTDAILAEGDSATIGAIWDFLMGRADQLYKDDGGREVPNNKHPRSHAQRLFDAFADKFFDGSGGSAGGGNKPTLIFTATVGDDGALDGFRQPGVGPIPASIFERYYCNADLIGVLFDGDGQPLWHGHKVRAATRAQVNALVVRDGGCVLCRAPHTGCQAHHLLPVGAPSKGPTDIDNLALVCQSCHTMIHETTQTLFQNTSGVWKLRDATPEEIPPRRPKAPKRE